MEELSELDSDPDSGSEDATSEEEADEDDWDGGEETLAVFVCDEIWTSASEEESSELSEDEDEEAARFFRFRFRFLVGFAV